MHSLQVDRVLHRTRTYLHDCETVELAHMIELIQYEKLGYHVLPDRISICDPNGRYRRVQIVDDV